MQLMSHKYLEPMSYSFDYLIYIGRFQPFHCAHLQTVQVALSRSRQVILALGSAQNERNLKNPFSAAEREQMILSNFSKDEQKRLYFVHVIDVYNDGKWVKQVKSLIGEVVQPNAKVGLIGHFKDASSYYLRLFPDWTLVELESLEGAVSATPLREAYYQGEIKADAFPAGTLKFLQAFQHTALYQQLQQKFQVQDLSNLEPESL